MFITRSFNRCGSLHSLLVATSFSVARRGNQHQYRSLHHHRSSASYGNNLVRKIFPYPSSQLSSTIRPSSSIPNRMSSDEVPVVVHNTQVVQQRIAAAVERHGLSNTVRLVAVSKTKPAENIQAIYDHAGHRHFGENYFQELVEKAAILPQDIHWHFIGHLQSSKASRLIREVPNLYVVETVDSEKLAQKLNNACETAGRAPLNIFIQVDTSGEETKSGVSDEELIPLVDFISQKCPKLILKGLMTIGAPGDFTCFDKLVNARKLVTGHLNMDETSLELSMGMSGDFEEAISRGATSVRVGSTIFGERIYHTKK